MAARDEFEQANRRAKDLQARIPKAVSAHYDRKNGLIVIRLSSNLVISFSPRDAEGLESARPSQLSLIEISPSGFGLHFPALDADLYIPGLFQGAFGSNRWMASRPPRVGSWSRMQAKTAVSKTNGKRTRRKTAVERS